MSVRMIAAHLFVFGMSLFLQGLCKSLYDDKGSLGKFTNSLRATGHIATLRI